MRQKYEHTIAEQTVQMAKIWCKKYIADFLRVLLLNVWKVSKNLKRILTTTNVRKLGWYCKKVFLENTCLLSPSIN